MLNLSPTRANSDAFVKLANIRGIETAIIGDELSYNDPSIDPRLTQLYDRADYDSKPKTKEQAESLGVKEFNGLQTSCRTIEDREGILHVTLQPARYLLSQAMEDGVKFGKFGKDDLYKISPRLANVSAIAIVRDPEKGSYYLIGQLKGSWVRGGGEVHAGLTAGGVQAKHLNAENPLLEALSAEALEEIGLKSGDLSPSNFSMMIDESPIGLVNFVAIAPGLQLDKVRERFWERTRGLEAEEREVKGLGLLPVAGLALIPMEQRLGIEGVRIITPTDQGLTEAFADKVARPYTVAMADFLGDKANQKMLLERAGF